MSRVLNLEEERSPKPFQTWVRRVCGHNGRVTDSTDGGDVGMMEILPPPPLPFFHFDLDAIPWWGGGQEDTICKAEPKVWF